MVIDDFQIQENIEDLIEKEGRFSDVKSKFWHESLIVYGTQRDDNKKCVIKIPIRDTSRKECQNHYDVKRIVEESINLVRIMDIEPLQYGDYFGVVMERAEFNLENYFPELNKSKDLEAEVKDIIIHVALGLNQLHKKGKIHRDLKPSNILRYDGKIWTVSDFGVATERKLTYSYESAEEYSSYEVLKQIAKGKRKKISFENDIFAVGAIMYQCFNPDHKTLRWEFNHSEGDEEYDEFVMNQIDKLKVSDDTKYFLKRLLSRELPEKIQPGTEKDYRYRDITTFIKELRTGEKVEEKTTSEEDPKYKEFLKLRGDFLKALEEARDNNEGKWETVDYKTIDNVMGLHDELEKSANTDTVKQSPKGNELYASATSDYEEVREKDEDILREKIAEGFTTGGDLRTAFEIAFLWGPPLTHQDRRGRDGKPRYTYDETKNRNTFYHEKYKDKFSMKKLAYKD